MYMYSRRPSRGSVFTGSHVRSRPVYRPRSISGHGAYRVKSASRTRIRKAPARRPRLDYGQYGGPAGSAIGTAIGSMFGSPMAGASIGSSLGALAGKALNSIMGHGAYTVQKNSLMSDQSVPQFGSAMKEDGAIRIRHREYITDVVSSSSTGAFKIDSYKISPSEPSTFPFLSQIASNFEEFMFEGLLFEFVSTSGSISSTQSLGTVCMATQYNSNSLQYVNKQQMETGAYSCSGCACNNLMHPIECDKAVTPSGGIFYTQRPQLASTADDQRWSNLGIFNIATQGVSGTSVNLGELWISYDCILAKPILIASSGQFDHWACKPPVGLASATPLASNLALSTNSTGFTTVNTTTGLTITIDPSFNGNFVVIYTYTTSSSTNVAPIITPSAGVSINLLLSGNTDYSYIVSGTIANVTMVAFLQMKSTGVPGILGFGSATVGGTPTAQDVFIIGLPQNLN